MTKVKLVLDTDSSNSYSIQIFKKDSDLIYIGNCLNLEKNFYFFIDKSDWISIKEFIDQQFKL